MYNDVYTTFSSSFGEMALRWQGDLLQRVELPHRSRSALQAAIRNESTKVEESLVPKWIKELINDIRMHLGGNFQTFETVPLDLSGISAFRRGLYSKLQSIPAGGTITYGELAKSVGSPDAARAVGSAMAHNPFPLIVPCHRVVGASADLVGFSAHGGVSTKARLLQIEGAEMGAAGAELSSVQTAGR